jgi:hypothetical protein
MLWQIDLMAAYLKHHQQGQSHSNQALQLQLAQQAAVLQAAVVQQVEHHLQVLAVA